METEEQIGGYTNTTSDRGEMGCEGVNEIILAWDKDQFRTFVIMLTDPVNFQTS